MIRGTPLPMATTVPQVPASRAPAAGANLLPFDPLAGASPAVAAPQPAQMPAPIPGALPGNGGVVVPPPTVPGAATPALAVAVPVNAPLPAPVSPSPDPGTDALPGVAAMQPSPPPATPALAVAVPVAVPTPMPVPAPVSPSPDPGTDALPGVAAMQPSPPPATPVHTAENAVAMAARPPADEAKPRAPEHPRPADACFPVPGSGLPATVDVPVLELHVAHAGGRIEVLSLPWRLAPSGVLSQRYDEMQAITRTGAPVALQAFAGTPARPGARSPMPVLPEAASASTGSSEGRSVFAEALRAPMPVADAADDDPLSQARQAAPQAQPWLERLYRWAERAGVDPSLWVRDYRLDPEQARDLASTLRSLARERGVSLQRIVVNGHEAWHAAASAVARAPVRHQED